MDESNQPDADLPDYSAMMGAIPQSVELQKRLASVTVTFNPELDILERQLGAIPLGCLKVVVDNGSANQNDILNFCANNSSVKLICIKENLGLAEALNRGVDSVADHSDAEYVLLLDQDSEPAFGSVEKLFNALLALEEKAGLCAAGPRMMDGVTGLHHGFHVIDGWRWRRTYPPADGAPVDCANINGSGIMTSIAAWKKSGGMDAGLFIDHVDTDWSFRMISKGMPLYGIPSAEFRHSMGIGSRRVWFFGWHVLAVRSPLRHYYLYRNTVRLIRRSYVPVVWKIWAVAKMAVTISMVLVFGPNRLKQMASIAKGLSDGFP